MSEIESATKISNLEQQLKELLERYEDMEGRYLELEKENKRLRELLQEKGESKSSKKPKFNLKYSVENTRVKKKRRHQSTGRRDGGGNCLR
jgi:cell shape-determining protein MreC